jgi:MFS family permease
MGVTAGEIGPGAKPIAVPDPGRGALAARLRLPTIYFVAAMTSVASTLLQVGIFFFTERCFGWTLRENFLLATVQGAVYVIGALLAHGFTQRLGRRRVLIVFYVCLGLAAAVAAWRTTPPVVAVVLVIYPLLIAVTWPVLESLISGRGSASEISRRLGLYNLNWSLVAALAVAGTGMIIERWQSGVFLLGAAIHLVGAGLLCLHRPADDGDALASGDARPAAAPEPKLLRQRRLALWLSRIALPAVYVVSYSLSAMLPSLPLIKGLPTAQATAAVSIWQVSRFLTFLILGATVWWHTRPRLLLWAAMLMFAAFLGIVLPANHGGDGSMLLVMMAAQVLLGMTTGMIYSASLYFGMVLSDGSTEHGGYHEALIGLGCVLGPGVGVIAQWLAPGNTSAAIASVGGLVALSVVAAGVASARHRSQTLIRQQFGDGASPLS